eukprot:4142859-Alexandrium_andersonii.AAC.1
MRRVSRRCRQARYASSPLGPPSSAHGASLAEAAESALSRLGGPAPRPGGLSDRHRRDLSLIHI